MASTSADRKVAELHASAVDEFRARVQDIPSDGWSVPTPCADWDVRALVNHVVGEELWTVPLLEGRTIEEVGDRYDGDVLGAAPSQAVDSSGKAAAAAFDEQGVLDRTVHLSFGDTPAAEYGWQLVADHLIHGWDVAAATGGRTQLDPGLVDAVAGWFAEREQMYRQAGAVADRPSVRAVGAQDALLVAFGRDPSWTPVHA